MNKCPVCDNDDKEYMYLADGLQGIEACLKCGAIHVDQKTYEHIVKSLEDNNKN